MYGYFYWFVNIWIFGTYTYVVIFKNKEGNYSMVDSISGNTLSIQITLINKEVGKRALHGLFKGSNRWLWIWLKPGHWSVTILPFLANFSIIFYDQVCILRFWVSWCRQLLVLWTDLDIRKVVIEGMACQLPSSKNYCTKKGCLWSKNQFDTIKKC